MNSIFRELYLGNISPTELRLPLSPEYRQTQHAFREKYDYFTQVLKTVRPDLSQTYDDLCELDMNMNMEDMESMFFHGLSIGIMLVAEAITVTQGGRL